MSRNFAALATMPLMARIICQPISTSIAVVASMSCAGIVLLPMRRMHLLKAPCLNSCSTIGAGKFAEHLQESLRRVTGYNNKRATWRVS
ncbi:unnamed protein product [Polarella glacialis]|uniref:Uncharacterized protein n=1 Tax=Polarella glacialis TaxID=89957 RepID=A0A813GG15_POLGL|nr:unnamed protein product [Polarella glacialis]